jgi:small subunit ribosomal protein S21
VRLSEVRIRDDESLDSALRRFKRELQRTGVLAEARRHEHYEKPSEKRRKRIEAARRKR